MSQHAASGSLQRVRRRGWLLLGLALICVLAFGLRLYDLEGQSLWSDEGLSLYRARLPLGDVLANTITVDGVRTNDTNPPFYFLLLHGWYLLFGQNVFLLRYLGVLAGMLSIPLLYGLGRVLFSWRAAVLAALFLALSPFHVWQTQVLRNYALLITINLLSVYGASRIILARRQGAGYRRWLALWLGAGVLAIYTHYFGFFVLAFTLAGLVVSLLWQWPGQERAGDGTLQVFADGKQRRPPWKKWLAPGLLAALAITLPALVLAYRRFRAGQQIDFYPVNTVDVAVQAAGAFGVGMGHALMQPSWLTAPALLLLLAGCWWGWVHWRQATLFVIGYLILPLGLLLALSAINPLFNGTRHLLIGLPPFVLLSAVAPAAFATRQTQVNAYVRRLVLFVAALFLVIQTVWLQRQFHHPNLVRDDVRAAADYLSRVAAPEDVVVLHDTLIKFTFDLYYEGQAPVLAVPLFGQHDEQEAIERLEGAGNDGAIVWFLTHPEPRTGFPRSLLREWADEHWAPLVSVAFDWMWLPVRLRAYDPSPEREAMPPDVEALRAQFGDVLTLHGLTAPAALQSGAPFKVSLYLSRGERLSGDYDISLRFTDDDGTIWQQIDEGLWPAYPPADWPDDTTVRYDHISRLPAGLTPGAYQLWLRVVDRDSGQPLLLPSGEADLRLPDVVISAASCDQKRHMGGHIVPSGNLFGAGLLLQGYSQPADVYRPGHVMALDVVWCVRRAPRQDYLARLQMTDEDGQVVAESLGAMARPDYAQGAWESGQLLAGKVQLVVPAATTEGSYRLGLAVVPAGGGGALPVDFGLSGRNLDLATVEVDPWTLETELPPIETPLAGDFGEPPLFVLRGYDLAEGAFSPGDALPLTLYWRSLVDAPPVNYDVFVHVVQDGQQPLAQADGPPLAGFRPTASWRQGEVFVDERTLTIPQNAPPGSYQLLVGFYNPDTGQRLPAFGEGQRQIDDAILLRQVEIAP